MHVLVATDGQLDPDLAAKYACPLAGPGGKVTVLTVVEIPRRLLSDLRGLYGEQPPAIVDRDAEYVTTGGSGLEPFHWPGDDTMIERYLADKRVQYTGPIVDALTAAGTAAEGVVKEGEDAAATILETIEELDADVVLIGSRGQGLFEGLLGSTGTKVTRRAQGPVLVLR